MDDRRIIELAELERTYWWHVGRRDVIRTLLSRAPLPPNGETRPEGDPRNAAILDVGCGTGVNVPLLASFGSVTGVEPSALARTYAQRETQAKVVDGTATALPFPDRSFDLLTCFDVLEHVEEDERALTEFSRVLRPGGLTLILVPAYQFLWSEHDESLGHERRYSVSELHRKLDRAGFDVLRRTYCITFLFLPILLYRFLRSLFPRTGPARTSYVILPRSLNALGVALLRLEAFLLRVVNFPFGVTCAVVARKRVHPGITGRS